MDLILLKTIDNNSNISNGCHYVWRPFSYCGILTNVAADAPGETITGAGINTEGEPNEER